MEQDHIKMDFELKTHEERIAKVNEIIANTPPRDLTPKYLDKLAEYIIMPDTVKERKQKNPIVTKNRFERMNMRETSFEGLVGKLENGEDGIYGMIANDKNIIFQPKAPITEEDLEEIPALRTLVEEIKKVEERKKTARGREASILHKQLKEMRKDQYEIIKAYKKPIYSTNLIKTATKTNLAEIVYIDEKGDVSSDGLINFYDEKHISALLHNYSKLKEDSWDKVSSDIKWLMEDFDNLVEAAIKQRFPLYYDLIIYKIDGKQNTEIQDLLYEKYGIKHSEEYISSLWCNKIPKLIVEEAKREYLVWYYTNVEYGHWKKCGRCGQMKLAHNFFFSKNSTSKDGFYSICKECRNKKK